MGVQTSRHHPYPASTSSFLDAGLSQNARLDPSRDRGFFFRALVSRDHHLGTCIVFIVRHVALRF